MLVLLIPVKTEEAYSSIFQCPRLHSLGPKARSEQLQLGITLLDGMLQGAL